MNFSQTQQNAMPPDTCDGKSKLVRWLTRIGFALIFCVNLAAAAAPGSLVPFEAMFGGYLDWFQSHVTFIGACFQYKPESRVAVAFSFHALTLIYLLNIAHIYSRFETEHETKTVLNKYWRTIFQDCALLNPMVLVERYSGTSVGMLHPGLYPAKLSLAQIVDGWGEAGKWSWVFAAGFAFFGAAFFHEVNEAAMEGRYFLRLGHEFSVLVPMYFGFVLVTHGLLIVMAHTYSSARKRGG